MINIFRVQVIAGCISLIIIGVIFELIRRRKFTEKYALLWIFSAIAIVIFSLFPKLLYKIARILDLHYITVLLIFIFLFLLAIILHLSISLSKIFEQNKTLAQEIGILRLRVKELKERIK